MPAQSEYSPIGVFDSGLGGLTAVRELIRLFPNEDIIYFGDTGRVPYGGRSAATINKYGEQAVKFLLSRGVRRILVACGTVSSAAMVGLCEKFPDIPITGVLEPSCIAAARVAEKTNNPRIGVIATQATVKTLAYTKRLSEISREFEIYEVPCPLFVPLVENGYVNPNDKRGAITKLIAEEYLLPLREKTLSALILGCTHYPMIEDIIRDVINFDKYGNELTTLINSGYEAVASLEIEDRPPIHKGQLEVYISDKNINSIEIASAFLGFDIGSRTQKIDIENF